VPAQTVFPEITTIKSQRVSVPSFINEWRPKMANLFEQNRNYVLGDLELDLIGDREKLAQWRHKGMGPAFYRLGRKIIYRGSDLNAWAESSRVDPGKGERA
jgi:hypothetical protein